MREPKAAPENELLAETALFDLISLPTSDWSRLLELVESERYVRAVGKRARPPLGPTALRRLWASALLICAERGDPVPIALAERAARALSPRAVRDRARRLDKQRAAATYLAVHPAASIGEIAKEAKVSRSTVQGFLKQARFKILVAEARGRLLGPPRKHPGEE